MPGSSEPADNISGVLDDSDNDAILQHLQENLSPEMQQNFNLFIYVDKAESGPFAQRMYVVGKTETGDLAPLYAWPVSTGRGGIERDPHNHVQSTFTPRGYFELDPKRMFENHVSNEWGESMPYAMFFNWAPHGHATGLAIHGTPDGADALGSPASAGCIRLSLEHARILFDLVQTQARGPVPKLAYLDGAEGESGEGLLLHDQQGQLQVADGYSVLVVVDDFNGEREVSSLS